MSVADWPMRPIGEIFDIGAGKTMSAAARAGENKVPFLRTSNVFWDRLDLTSLDQMAMSDAELKEKNLLPGDLLVCEGGEIGRAAIWDGSIGRITFQNHLHRLRLKPEMIGQVDPRFYVFFLQSGFTQLGVFEGVGNKTTIPNLSRSRVAALDVPFPPLIHQQRLVAVLGKLRESIEVQKASIGRAAELRSAAVAQLLTYGMRRTSLRDTGHGLVPPDWTIGRVGEFAQFQRGFDITKRMQVESGTVPVVSSGGTKSYHDVAAATGPGVVIGRKGSIGSLHYIEKDFWPHDTTLWCSDFKGNVPKFVYYRLHLVDMKRLDSGAANPALNRNFLHDETITWPSVEEQHEIVSVLDSIDQKHQLHCDRLQMVQGLFDRLLRDVMTGEVASDELAVPDELIGSAA